MGIFRFMLPWTVQILGRIQSCFSWMQRMCRVQWQDVLQMDFLRLDSFGETLYINGIITEIQGMSGGFPDWNIVSVCMM